MNHASCIKCKKEIINFEKVDVCNNCGYKFRIGTFIVLERMWCDETPKLNKGNFITASTNARKIITMR